MRFTLGILTLALVWALTLVAGAAQAHAHTPHPEARAYTCAVVNVRTNIYTVVHHHTGRVIWQGYYTDGGTGIDYGTARPPRYVRAMVEQGKGTRLRRACGTGVGTRGPI